jgi:hypothetical protein
MSTRAIKPREYFKALLDMPEEKINYSEIPATTKADWEDAEVLLPVTAEEFEAIKTFIRQRRAAQETPPTLTHTGGDAAR